MAAQIQPHRTIRTRPLLILILLLGAALQLGSSANAQSLGDIWGSVSTLKTAFTDFIGTTTVTPAYAIHMWRMDSSGYYGNTYYEMHWRVDRDPLTGWYGYEFRNVLPNGGQYLSKAAFQLDAAQRLNFYCDRTVVNPDGTVVPFTYKVTREFEIAVWVARLHKTGYFPPGAPYRTQLKSMATELETSCKSLAKPEVRETRRDLALADTGYVVVKMALVSYGYSWPMLCWAGETWDY